MEKKKTYSELLRSPLWQKKRLEIMQRDNFTCQHCGCEGRELQVHHKVYHKDAKPWEYDDSELITLCELCHAAETVSKREMYKLFMEVNKLSRELGFSEQLLWVALVYIYDELMEMKGNGRLSNANNSMIADVVFKYPMLSDAKILYNNGIYPSAKHMEHINKVLPDFFTNFTKIYGSRIDNQSVE